MIELVGVHGVNETHLVHDVGVVKVGHGVGKPRSAITILGELARRPHQLRYA